MKGMSLNNPLIGKLEPWHVQWLGVAIGHLSFVWVETPVLGPIMFAAPSCV